MPDEATALDLYGQPQDQQAARVAARIAALRGQQSIGAGSMMSTDPGLQSFGKMTLQQTAAEIENLRHTSESMLKETLWQKQLAVQNEHNRLEYERQVASDAEHAGLMHAQIRHLAAETNKARQPEPKYTLKPGIGPNGEAMYVSNDPTLPPLPLAEQTSIAADPVKQRAMAIRKLPANEGKLYESNDSTLQSLKRLREKMVEHPNAFGITADIASYLPEKAPQILKNLLGSQQAKARVGSGDQEVFTLAQNIGQKIVRERAGLRGETSPMVQAKIGAFLPKPTDPLPVALSKVDSYINELTAEQEDKHRLYNIPALPQATAPRAAAPAVQQRALQYLQANQPTNP